MYLIRGGDDETRVHVHSVMLLMSIHDIYCSRVVFIVAESNDRSKCVAAYLFDCCFDVLLTR